MTGSLQVVVSPPDGIVASLVVDGFLAERSGHEKIVYVSARPLIQVSRASPKAPEFAKFEIKEPVGQTGVDKRLTERVRLWRLTSV